MLDTRIVHSLLLVLAHTCRERSTPSLVQALDVAPIQVDMTLVSLQENGLIQETERACDWSLTPKGRMALPDSVAFLEQFDVRTGVEDLLLFCEKKEHDKACVQGCAVMHTLLEAGRTPGAGTCLEILSTQMRLWHPHLTSSEIAVFLECVFSLSDVSLFLMRDIASTYQLIQSAIQSATKIGDSRTLILLRFLLGYSEMFLSSNNFSPVHVSFTHAIQLLSNFGDKEIYSRASPFLVLFHFIKGDFQRAIEHYELLQKAKLSTNLYFMEMQLVLYASSSLAYLGHFSHAFGMLKSSIRTTSLSGKILLNMLYRQHLGTLLIYMDRHEEGMDVLQGVVAETNITTNPKVMVRAFAGMAYSHFKQGNLAASHQVLSNAVDMLERHPNFSLSFNYPWMLELIGKYVEHNLPLPKGIDLDTLVNNTQTSPSMMLQGQAMRFKAGRLALQQAPLDEVLHCLDSSLTLLKRIRAPIEIARTEKERATVLHLLGRDEEAKRADDHARELFGRYVLGSTNTTVTEQVGARSDKSLLDECFAKLSVRSAWETLAEAAQQMALVARQLFEMERTALFKAQGDQVLCIGSCNISEAEQASVAFAKSRSLIERQIHLDTPFRSLGKNLTIVCIPFSIPGSGNWLLYADSSLPFHRGSQPSDETLLHLGHFFALELCNTLRTQATRMEPRQNDTVVFRESERAPVLWGVSPSFKVCLEQANVVASTDASVLLLGETGVGKEVMANYIHRNSNSTGPFVAVHPASVSESLFESEFFGHEKGSFTGAVKQKIGLFELANRGTLFIDEAGDIPFTMQIKLLRVLQEHTFMRVGGTKEIYSSFRLITATNRNLLDAVHSGTFREDLYYRLSVVPLLIPPLRERKDDIEALVLSFINYFSKKYRKNVFPPDKQVLQQLVDYAWPGNLRELKNCVEHAVILHSGGELDLLVGKSRVVQEAVRVASLPENTLYADMPSLEELQRRYIQYILNKTGGRVCGENGAESILKMKRSTLYVKLRQFNIDRKQDS